jgi:hypothetical protein
MRQWDKEHLELKRVVVPIIATGSDLSFEPVGSAFIIHCDGKNALALSAAHNIRHILSKIERPYELCHETTLPEFRIHVQDIEFRNTRMRVVFPDQDGKIYLIDLPRAYVLDESDIAVCVLRIPDDMPPSLLFEKKLAIDSSPPKAETPIAALGYSSMFVSSQSIVTGGARVTHNETLRRRGGRIVDVFPNGGLRNHRMPCFECTTPFDNGMSGGPIVAMSGDDTVAIGIITADFSFDPSHHGSGENAIASILWPAMGIQMKMEYLDAQVGPTLLDFQKRNLVVDKGKASEHVRFTKHPISQEPSMLWLDTPFQG